MNKLISTGLVFAGAMMPVVSAEAANYISLSNTVNTLQFSDTYVNPGQEFTATTNNISGAGFALLRNAFTAGSGTVTISLSSGSPFGALTQLATATTTGISGSWVDVFWNPVALTIGQTYYIDIYSAASLRIGGSSDVYSGGIAWAQGLPFSSYDTTFRTFASDTFVAPAAVPEAASWALMVGGFGLLGAALRRRRVRVTFA